MRTHELKILPKYFKRLMASELPFQIRKNDRDYQSGDLLILMEFEPDGFDGNGSPVGGRYTGVGYRVLINRVYDDLPGLQPGYVVFTHRACIQR